MGAGAACGAAAQAPLAASLSEESTSICAPAHGRARGALRTLLYGTGDELDLSKLQEVTRGLESYTVSTASVASSTGASDEGRNAAASQLHGLA